ncbi:alpha/beta fold hydrolase [Staphylococcus durrellii]|uniref:alpha/beta fold hydrolase n=1 Tax=Staphylococcus durrellii TaxID=2781773 RepID=UPI00189D2F91|nr:alpha/beta hydrolase [Staphylococcus durrellii]MBF7017759.1 alpha/beta hydrolase [Staphylococcus durrellii]
MNKILVDSDDEIAYTREGQGIPIILIHALDGNMAAFINLKQELKQHYEVITYDVRGHGYSSKPVSYDLSDHINDLAKILEKLNIVQTHIIGHEMGSVIAKTFAEFFEEKVLSLTLISYDFTNGSHGINKLMFEHQDEIVGFDKAEALIVLFPYIYRAQESARKWLQEQRIYARQKDEYSAIANRALMSFPTYRDEKDIKRGNVPILIVNGKCDPLVNHENVKAILKTHGDINLNIFKESGHAPHIEEPMHFENAFNNFINATKLKHI